MTTAGEPIRRKVRSPAPSMAVSSSWTILTTCWPALTLSRTSWPMARSRDARDEVLDHLEVDVRLEQRQPDLAHRRVDVGFGDPAVAGQLAEGVAQSIG